MKWFRSRAGAPARSQGSEGAPAAAPRHTTLAIVRGERLELRDASGRVIAWTRPDRELSSIRDPGGHQLVSFRPGVKQMFSVGNIATLAVEGAVFGDDTPIRRYSPGSPVAPPLDLHDMTGGFTFAQVVLGDEGLSLVGLLPSGPANNRMLERRLGADEASRLRARSPLTYTKARETLRDQAGQVIAQVQETGRQADQRYAEHVAVQVGDNDLPAVWLLAIVLACRQWGR